MNTYAKIVSVFMEHFFNKFAAVVLFNSLMISTNDVVSTKISDAIVSWSYRGNDHNLRDPKVLSVWFSPRSLIHCNTDCLHYRKLNSYLRFVSIKDYKTFNFIICTYNINSNVYVHQSENSRQMVPGCITNATNLNNSSTAKTGRNSVARVNKRAGVAHL